MSKISFTWSSYRYITGKGDYVLMRKMNWLVGSIALGIGLVIGMVGYALAITPVDGDSKLVNFWKDKPVTGTLQDQAPQSPTDTLNPLSPEENSLETPGTTNDSLPGSASGEGALNIPATSDPTFTQNSGVPTELAQKITTDYKQDIALFFDAWKSPEMMSFRSKLIKAYTGDLYEKHARQAERFIAQGIGIEVSQIQFDQVNVESATANAATLTASYRYVSQDYDIGEQVTIGEPTEHQVKVRVNLIKDNTRWLITGETPLQ